MRSFAQPRHVAGSPRGASFGPNSDMQRLRVGPGKPEAFYTAIRSGPKPAQITRTIAADGSYKRRGFFDEEVDRSCRGSALDVSRTGGGPAALCGGARFGGS